MTRTTAAPEQTFEQADGRRRELVARLESGAAGLRETVELCREASVLIRFCAAELEQVEGELTELDLDGLAARLNDHRQRDVGAAVADRSAGGGWDQPAGAMNGLSLHGISLMAARAALVEEALQHAAVRGRPGAPLHAIP